jgi:hypothetical protein
MQEPALYTKEYHLGILHLVANHLVCLLGVILAQNARPFIKKLQCRPASCSGLYALKYV